MKEEEEQHNVFPCSLYSLQVSKFQDIVDQPGSLDRFLGKRSSIPMEVPGSTAKPTAKRTTPSLLSFFNKKGNNSCSDCGESMEFMDDQGRQEHADYHLAVRLSRQDRG